MNLAKLAEQTYGVMKSFGFHLKMYDETGASTLNSKEARFFYSKSQHIMCAIYTESMDGYLNLTLSQETDVNEYTDLISKLRYLANFHNIIFTTKKSNGNVTPKDFAYLTKVEESMKINENFGMPAIDKIIDQYSGATNVVGDVMDIIIARNGVTVTGIKDYIDGIHGEGTFTQNKDAIKSFVNELLQKNIIVRRDDKKYYLLDDAPMSQQEQAMGHAINHYYSAVEIVKDAGSIHLQDWIRKFMMKEQVSPQYASGYISHMLENNRFLFDINGNIVSFKEEKPESSMDILRRSINK